MLDVTTHTKWLPLFEALASEVRLKIVQLLVEQPLNIKQLAERLQLSSAIVTMHVKKLEQAGIVESKMVRKDGGTHKMCMLKEKQLVIDLVEEREEKSNIHHSSIPVGQFTACEIHPTCGLATTEKMIGLFDDPRYFYSPERIHASILWLGYGFVEYTIANFILPSQHITEIEFSMEISSEAPGINEQWPSDIFFSLNGVELGIWTSPGDFGIERGRYTPKWWGRSVNQYGLLKKIKIDDFGTWIDGDKMSDVTLKDIDFSEQAWKLRIGVKEDALHVGGLTIFGKGFGNYGQHINFDVKYDFKQQE